MTTILSLNDWFEVTSRGTSGDQVSDILYSWKEQSEKKDAEIERLREALTEIECRAYGTIYDIAVQALNEVTK